MPKTATNNSPLGELVAELGIADYDVLLIGDGSGCSWDIGCGWACVLIDRFNKGRKLFSGGMNTGTVAISELMPYVHALSWYVPGPGKTLRQRFSPPRPIRVHIVTDSQATYLQGEKLRRTNCVQSLKTNRHLWASIHQFSRDGFDIQFHWVGRSKIGLNVLVDLVAGKHRLAAQGVQLPQGDDGETISIYDVNTHSDVVVGTNVVPAKPKSRSHIHERPELARARRLRKLQDAADWRTDPDGAGGGGDSDIPF